MKFLPLLLCACFIYAGNGIAAPSGAAGIDAPAKIKHARFILELDANVAVLKNLDGEIYAGLDNGKLYKITINSAESSMQNSAAGQNFRCRKFFSKFREAKFCRKFYDIKFCL